MLAGAGLGDNFGFAHPFGQQSLAQHRLVLCAPPCSRSSRFRYRVVRVPSVRFRHLVRAVGRPA
nr:Uncharacterised protein [Klebsiella pneumoniae]